MKNTTMKILLAILVPLVFLVPVFAGEMTPEQKAEKANIEALMAEANKNIPPDTIITNINFKAIHKTFEGLIKKFGYSEKEYSIDGRICACGQVHFYIYIKTKTTTGVWELKANYIYRHEEQYEKLFKTAYNHISISNVYNNHICSYC